MTVVRPSLAFVGLGAMGSRMVRHIAAAEEFAVGVFDVNPAAMHAATEAAGVRAMRAAHEAADADVIVLMLPNSEVVRQVLGSADDAESLVRRLRRGALVIDMGSSNPSETRDIAAELALLGVSLVDAPVSGGPRKAETAELTVMVGAANNADLKRALPVLSLVGASVTHVGGVGCGHALKALNNLLSAAGLVAAVEALTVAAAFGLDPSVALDVINQSTGRNQSTEVKLKPQVIDGQFNVGFSLPLSVKDVLTALDLSKELAIDTPVSTAAGGVMKRALDWLGSDSNPDQSEVALYVEHLSGVRLRP